MSGLYLRILKSGERRWVLRYKIAGKTRVATFGDASTIGLAEARAKAAALASRHPRGPRSGGGR